MFKFFNAHDLLLIVAVALVTRCLFANIVRVVDSKVAATE